MFRLPSSSCKMVFPAKNSFMFNEFHCKILLQITGFADSEFSNNRGIKTKANTTIISEQSTTA